MGTESEKLRNGGFETFLFGVGLISGGIFGFNNGGWWGLLIGAITFGAVGKFVGALADWAIKIGFLIAYILINGTVRRFIWDMISELF